MRQLAWLTTRGEILTQEFLPGLAPSSIRWLRTPLGSLGLAAAAAGLCGMFLHPQGFVVFFGILVVTTLGLVWPWLSVRGLSGSLSFDRSRCREGESVAARLTLRNRMPWGAWGISVQGGFHDPAGDSRDDISLVGLAVVPGWRAIAETVEFVPGCRGEYPSRVPRVVCGFPFGRIIPHPDVLERGRDAFTNIADSACDALQLAGPGAGGLRGRTRNPSDRAR